MVARLNALRVILAVPLTILSPASFAVGQYAVSVIPDGAPTPNRTPFTNGHSEWFTIQNTGTADDTYLVWCTQGGPVTCTGVSATEVFVPAGGDAQVQAFYNVGAAGTGMIGLMASSYGAGIGAVEDPGHYTVPVVSPPPPPPPPPSPPVVTPDGAPRLIVPITDATLPFAVKNPNTGARSYNLSASCSGAVISCLAPGPVAVSAGQSVEVWPTFSVAGSAFQTGTLTLTATDQGTPTVADNGSLAVTRAPSGPVVERGLCLTIAAGAGAAYECGDLRLAHGLPGVRTLNKGRAPVLLYNSQHARPYPLVYADVTAPSPLPQTIRAILRVNGAEQAQRDVAGSVWESADQVRRVVVGFAADTFPTGLHSYELEIQRLDPSVVTLQTLSGQLPIVNRRSSAFGPGWWLAGWERLHSLPGLPDGQMMWVGGDGSVRRYERSGVVGADTVYLAPLVDSPDTLLHTAANEWKRLLPGGGHITFTANGVHTRTTNRLGYQTDFLLDGASNLLKIRLQPDTTIAYTFAYAGTPARLASVSAPDSAAGTFRVTSLTYAGDTLKITDPGSPPVGYRYDAGGQNRILSRKDRRGALTIYLYDAVSRLASSKALLPSADSIVLAFCAAEVSGLVACRPTPVVPDSAYTRFDGPRTDSADVHAFWVDRFGSPWKVRDPYHNVTTVTRAEPSFPALATRVQYPNGRIVAATYDARGNMASTTDSSVFGPGQHATTRHQWDQRWDQITEVVAPTGQITRFGYNATNGNREWQEDGRGTSSRVTFAYYPSGDGAGLVKFVTVPGGAKDSLGYDPRGNLNASRTPLGWLTYVDNDRLGRPRVVRTQIAGGAWRRDSTFYDVSDQVVRTVAYGPSLGGAPAQSLRTRSFYNDEGQLESLERWDPNGFGTITTRWRYDLAGRVRAEVAPDGAVDSTRYDAAGNAIAVVTRRGDTLTMVYDRLNRLRRRTVPPVTYYGRLEGIAAYQLNFNGRRPYPWYPTAPASPIACQTDSLCYQDPTQWTLTIPGDVATFTYDAMGNLTRADNSAALIRRGYFPNGLLKADTLRIWTYAGTDTLQHAYVIGHRYDLAGRRTVVKHPSQLAARVGGAVKDSVRYVFDPVTGALQTVYDPLGNAFQFTYDLRNERIRLDLPGAIRQHQGYDLDGRLVADTIVSESTSPWRIGAGCPHPSGCPNPVTTRLTRLHYADALRVDTAANALWRQDTTIAMYSGLGHLVRMDWRQPTVTEVGNPSRVHSTEWFALDALGNAYWRRDSTNSAWRSGFGGSGKLTNGATRTSRFAALTNEAPAGRLRATEDHYRIDSLRYDAGGNTLFSSSTPRWPDTATVLEERAYFYGADGHLRMSEYRWLSKNPPHPIYSETWEWTVAVDEYRYDALGRRVVVRTRRTCRDYTNFRPCTLGTLRRTVWDGNEELYEIQAFGGGGDGPPPASAENDTAQVFLGMPWVPGAGPWDPNPQFGRVAYTHGPGLDQPLALTRINFIDTVHSKARVDWEPLTIVPHWNWRGQADFGTMADGGSKVCQINPPDRCVWVAWANKRLAYVQQEPDRGRWWGTVLGDKEDGAGTVFRRNRYVDPATGRFTQEDPIGLAGGLNLYGFASGDPVTFSDPFGLCPRHLRALAAFACHTINATTTALGTVLGFVGGGGGGLLVSAPTAGTAAPVTVPAGAIAGAAAGGAAGAALGNLITNALFSEEGPGSGPTRHGGRRAADPSRLNTDEAAGVVKDATQQYVQRDGAQVFVQQVGNRYNVVVQNQQGRMITNFKTIDQRALDNLSRNYGWAAP